MKTNSIFYLFLSKVFSVLCFTSRIFPHSPLISLMLCSCDAADLFSALPSHHWLNGRTFRGCLHSLLQLHVFQRHLNKTSRVFTDHGSNPRALFHLSHSQLFLQVGWTEVKSTFAPDSVLCHSVPFLFSCHCFFFRLLPSLMLFADWGNKLHVTNSSVDFFVSSAKHGRINEFMNEPEFPKHF